MSEVRTVRPYLATLDFRAVEKTLRDTLASAWTHGAARAAKYAKAKGVDFHAEVIPPREAIAWIKKRVPLPLKELEKILLHTGDAAAFLVRDLIDVIAEKIDERLKAALVEGADMRAFLKGLPDAIEAVGLTAKNPYYWQTVFRTNVQTALQAGREKIFRTPEVTEVFGFFVYSTAGDSAVRPEHAALEGMTWRADDPDVKRFWPPLGFNCRCAIHPISAGEMKAEGLSLRRKTPRIDGKGVRPDEGFEGLPSKRFAMRK